MLRLEHSYICRSLLFSCFFFLSFCFVLICLFCLIVCTVTLSQCVLLQSILPLLTYLILCGVCKLAFGLCPLSQQIFVSGLFSSHLTACHQRLCLSVVKFVCVCFVTVSCPLGLHLCRFRRSSCW